MKVLFLTNVPAPYRVEFFNRLGDLCDLTVVYELRAAGDRESTWSTVRATAFTEVYLRGLKVQADAAFCPQVLGYLIDRSYDIVVVGGYSTPTGMWSIAWLRMLGIPFVLSVDGGLPKKDVTLARLVKRWFISAASAWLSTGRVAGRYLQSYGAEAESIFDYPFTSFPAGVVAKGPSTASERTRLRTDLEVVEPRCVLAVGRFVESKGFDLLIEAAPQLGADVGVYIVGGAPTPEYEELVERHRAVNVHFRPFMSPPELRRYYRMADAFVLPTRSDVWGLVVNEAMAQGCPVVTTDQCVAGLELVCDGVQGRVVPADDVSGLVAGLRSVLEPDVAGRMAQASLDRAASYTLEQMARRHREVFDTLLSRGWGASRPPCDGPYTAAKRRV